MARESANAPFLRNAWYIACWDDDLAGGVFGRTIMNEPIAFFRDASGKAGAVEDRCCHRGAALTDGKVIDRGLQCGYHGLVFDVNGKCVEIPGQDAIPPMAHIKSYPVVERHEAIWIWMGDPALADESKIVDWPFHKDGATPLPHRKGCLPFSANYLMLVDNLMDLTHLGFVHSRTIGGHPMQHVNAEMSVERTENGCRFSRWMMDSNAPPTYVKAAGFTGKIDRWLEFEYRAPCLVLQYTGAIDAGRGAKQNQNQPGFHSRIIHCATPETETSAFYIFAASNGYRTDDPAATQELYDQLIPTFIEDVTMMSNQQSRINLDPTRPLLNIKADAAVVQARRAFHAAFEAEQKLHARAAE
jgi:vanillate O-demethylase monooxygenase subunit